MLRTTAQTKAIVKSTGRLHLTEYAGQTWATDNYWLTPVSGHVATMLAKFDVDGVGTYEVNGKFEKTPHEPPTIDKLIPAGFDDPSKSEAFELAEYVKLPGLTSKVFVNPDTPAVLMGAHGHTFGLNVDFLRMLTGRVDPFATYDADNRRTVGLRVWSQRPTKAAYGGGLRHYPLVIESTHETRITYMGGKPNETVASVDRRSLLMAVKVS